MFIILFETYKMNGLNHCYFAPRPTKYNLHGYGENGVLKGTALILIGSILPFDLMDNAHESRQPVSLFLQTKWLIGPYSCQTQ